MFANKSFWPWKFREGLPALGTARREAEFVGAEVVFSSSDLFFLRLTVLVFCSLGKSQLLPWGF